MRLKWKRVSALLLAVACINMTAVGSPAAAAGGVTPTGRELTETRSGELEDYQIQDADFRLSPLLEGNAAPGWTTLANGNYELTLPRKIGSFQLMPTTVDEHEVGPSIVVSCGGITFSAIKDQPTRELELGPGEAKRIGVSSLARDKVHQKTKTVLAYRPAGAVQLNASVVENCEVLNTGQAKAAAEASSQGTEQKDEAVLVAVTFSASAMTLRNLELSLRFDPQLLQLADRRTKEPTNLADGFLQTWEKLLYKDNQGGIFDLKYADESRTGSGGLDWQSKNMNETGRLSLILWLNDNRKESTLTLEDTEQLLFTLYFRAQPEALIQTGENAGRLKSKALSFGKGVNDSIPQGVKISEAITVLEPDGKTCNDTFLAVNGNASLTGTAEEPLEPEPPQEPEFEALEAGAGICFDSADQCDYGLLVNVSTNKAITLVRQTESPQKSGKSSGLPGGASAGALRLNPELGADGTTGTTGTAGVAGTTGTAKTAGGPGGIDNSGTAGGGIDYVEPIPDLPDGEDILPVSSLENGSLNGAGSGMGESVALEEGAEQSFLTRVLTSSAVRWQEKPFFLLAQSGRGRLWLCQEDWTKDSYTQEQLAEIRDCMDRSLEYHERNAGALYDANKDGYVDFLLYDMQDQYNSTLSYYTGLFNANELFAKKYDLASKPEYAEYCGNQRDVVHLDTYPTIRRQNDGSLDISSMLSTITHESQHLAFASSIYRYCVEKYGEKVPFRVVQGGLKGAEVWINEGLSMMAEDALHGVLDVRIDYFAASEAVQSGRVSLTNWGSTVADYSLNYGFFQYLLHQAASPQEEAALRRALYQYYGNANAMPKKAETAIQSSLSAFADSSLEEVIRDYNLALALGERSGRYSFNGDPDFDRMRLAPREDREITLSPMSACLQKVGAGGSFSSESGGAMGLQPLGLRMGREYTLTVKTDGDGEGNVTVSPRKATYEYGETVTLTATPGADSEFVGWTGSRSSSWHEMTLQIDGSKTVTAEFRSPGGGEIPETPSLAPWQGNIVPQLPEGRLLLQRQEADKEAVGADGGYPKTGFEGWQFDYDMYLLSDEEQARIYIQDDQEKIARVTLETGIGTQSAKKQVLWTRDGGSFGSQLFPLDQLPAGDSLLSVELLSAEEGKGGEPGTNPANEPGGEPDTDPGEPVVYRVYLHRIASAQDDPELVLNLKKVNGNEAGSGGAGQGSGGSGPGGSGQGSGEAGGSGSSGQGSDPVWELTVFLTKAWMGGAQFALSMNEDIAFYNLSEKQVLDGWSKEDAALASSFLAKNLTRTALRTAGADSGSAGKKSLFFAVDTGIAKSGGAAQPVYTGESLTAAKFYFSAPDSLITPENLSLMENKGHNALYDLRFARELEGINLYLPGSLMVVTPPSITSARYAEGLTLGAISFEEGSWRVISAGDSDSGDAAAAIPGSWAWLTPETVITGAGIYRLEAEYTASDSDGQYWPCKYFVTVEIEKGLQPEFVAALVGKTGGAEEEIVTRAALSSGPALQPRLFTIAADGGAGAGDMVTPFGELTYTSSDPAVAEVASDGAVTLKGSGVVTLTVSCDGGGVEGNYEAVSASTTLTVYDVPKAPAKPKANVGNASIKVTWAPIPEEDLNYGAFQSYVLELTGPRTTAGEITTQAITITTTALTYTFSDVGLTNGQTYEIKLKAVNEAGEGPWSEPVAAVPKKEDGGGGGGGGSGGSNLPEEGQIFTVRYDAGQHGTVSVTSEKVPGGKSPTGVEVTVKEGWRFAGWSLDGSTLLKLSGYTVTQNVTLIAVYVPEGERIPGEPSELRFLKTKLDEVDTGYISGYSPEDTASKQWEFRPDDPISRAEIAALVCHVINISKTPGLDYAVQLYSDVPEVEWFAEDVGFLSRLGILSGYPDGTFRPQSSITRAELVTLVIKLDGLTDGEVNFKDVIAGEWYEPYVEAAVGKEFVSGYEDGTFGPDRPLTRAEAVTIINRVIGLMSDMMDMNEPLPFMDVPQDHWAYKDIYIASMWQRI